MCARVLVRVLLLPLKVCVVTGGTGFVGQRLVEMLVQRGATKVCTVLQPILFSNAWPMATAGSSAETHKRSWE